MTLPDCHAVEIEESSSRSRIFLLSLTRSCIDGPTAIRPGGSLTAQARSPHSPVRPSCGRPLPRRLNCFSPAAPERDNPDCEAAGWIPQARTLAVRAWLLHELCGGRDDGR